MSQKSKGRQKLEMVRISKESNLLVTFSKRRYGIFKKASELATLCGAQITVIVFSPGKKIFSFGHPSVEAVVERFLSRSPPQISGALQLIEAHRNARVCDVNLQLTQVQSQLEKERKRGQEIDRAMKVSQAENWWECPIEELNLAQLEQLKASLELLKQNVGKQAEQLLIQTTNPAPPPPPPPPFYMPNSASTRILPFDPNNSGFTTNMMSYQHSNLGFGNGLF